MRDGEAAGPPISPPAPWWLRSSPGRRTTTVRFTGSSNHEVSAHWGESQDRAGGGAGAPGDPRVAPARCAEAFGRASRSGRGNHPLDLQPGGSADANQKWRGGPPRLSARLHESESFNL